MAAKFSVVGSSTFLKSIVDQMSESVEQRATDSVKELIDELQIATPIDTGYARSRWTVDRTVNTGMSFKVRYSPYVFNILSRDFVISNDADYIKHLNAGSSIQAPSYFIEKTILKNGFKLNSVLVNSP